MLNVHSWAKSIQSNQSPWHKVVRHGLCGMLILLMAMSCRSDAIVGNKYCNLPARFTYTPVSAISQLYAACEAMNEWCTITADPDRFIFTNLGGSTPVNRTAGGYYVGINMGLRGFIVGRPPLSEMGYDAPAVTCYDLACSNCYDQGGQRLALTLMTGGRAFCNTCQRTYDLNNMGIASKGDRGIPLYRYRVTYTKNTLVINNY